MIVVIIAGGSGTRLWPLSTPSHPKHLLKIDNVDLSLLQLTYNRAKSISDSIYVVTESGHVLTVREQLTQVPSDKFIIEPGRRGTANCILSSLIYLQCSKVSPNEPIAILPSDHFVRDIDGFEDTFKIASALSQSHKKLALIGVEPDYPSTGFGYIQKGSKLKSVNYAYNVLKFAEKPDYTTALKYVHSGNYLWNSGYFIGSLNIFKESIKLHAPQLFKNYKLLSNSINKEQYIKNYLSLETLSIDYALIEKMPNLLVVPAMFDWLDVGTYSDLHKIVSKEEGTNNYSRGPIYLNNVTDSYLSNKSSKPLVVIGLDNIVVINSEHGLLVMNKNDSQSLGSIVKDIKD